MLFKNKKTGNIYRHLGPAIDCTNSRDGTGVVVYCPADTGHPICVRESSEFYQKFEKISSQTGQELPHSGILDAIAEGWPTGTFPEA